MERLTKRLPSGTAVPSENWIPTTYEATCQELAQRLADYEDAEEQGRLIEFPVAIGDHIYEVIPIDEGQIRELSVKTITLFGDGTYLLYCTDGTYESYFNSRRLGTLMFPTRDEAEARLKELEAENGH